MQDWTGVLLALAAFFVGHSLPTRPRVKARIVAHVGARGFTLAYSALSLLLLWWLIRAAQMTPAAMLWSDSSAQLWITRIAMLGACVIAAYALMSPNPLSFGGNARPFDPDNPGIVGLCRHPMLLALALWALGHLASNGQAALALVFALMAAFALLGMPLIDRKKRRELGSAQWDNLAKRTSNIPFRALCSLSLPRLLPVLLGLATWSVLVFAHPYVIGLRAL